MRCVTWEWVTKSTHTTTHQQSCGVGRGLDSGWTKSKLGWHSCKLIHKKCRHRSYYNGIKYTLNSIISTFINHALSNILSPKERMFLVQISLLIVTFLSFISWVLPLMRIIIEANPHPCIAPCVNMWSVFFFFVWHLLNCWCMNMSHCLGRPSGRLTMKMDHVLRYHRYPTISLV